MFGEPPVSPTRPPDSTSDSHDVRSDRRPPFDPHSRPNGDGRGEPSRRAEANDARRSRETSEAGNVTGLLDGLIGLVRSLGEFADKGRQLRHTSGRGDLKVETTMRVRSLFDDHDQPTRDDEDSLDESKSAPNQERSSNTVAVKVGGALDGRHGDHAPLTPHYDRFDDPDGVTLLFEMPGVNRLDEVDLELDGDLLFVETNAARRYRVEVMLDHAFDPNGVRSRLTHGVLEVRLNR